MLVEKTNDWRYVYSKYKHSSEIFPRVGGLIYFTYYGIYRIENVYSDCSVSITYEGQSIRIQRSLYRLIEPKD